MPMTFVEARSFEMGNMNGLPDQMPVHSVSLPAFEISTFEVTVGQFSQFVNSTGYVTELEKCPEHT